MGSAVMLLQPGPQHAPPRLDSRFMTTAIVRRPPPALAPEPQRRWWGFLSLVALIGLGLGALLAWLFW